MAYDASGNTVIPPSGFALHIDTEYDKANRLARIRTTRASSDSTVVADLSYCYSPFVAGQACPTASATTDKGRRQWSKNNLTGAVTTYRYDQGGRLTEGATGGGATYGYGYDPNGNRTAGPEGTHTYNSANQLTDAGVAYDADVNLTAAGAFPALGYNGADQTTSITPSGQPALPLRYADATQDERTAVGTTTYVNGLVGIQSQTPSSCILGICLPGTTTYFERDPQGTLLSERIGSDEYYYVFDGMGSVIGARRRRRHSSRLLQLRPLRWARHRHAAERLPAPEPVPLRRRLPGLHGSLPLRRPLLRPEPRAVDTARLDRQLGRPGEWQSVCLCRG